MQIILKPEDKLYILLVVMVLQVFDCHSVIDEADVSSFLLLISTTRVLMLINRSMLSCVTVILKFGLMFQSFSVD